MDKDINRVIHGDCLEVMKEMPDGCVDSVITDPPYELGFMGKKWDSSGISYRVDVWAECLRVLKPGGHLLAFGGSRTYHRLACAIEDAGFEIRDQIMWIYGSGFPKSLDVSKAIDKAAGAEREQVPPRSVISHQRNIGNRRPYMDDPNHKTDSDVPVTDSAKKWSGFGTALKPAHEPIVVARKPLIGTVAENVLTHGAGALNIDGCRVEYTSDTDKSGATPQGRCTNKVGALAGGIQNDRERTEFERQELKGRWPANVIHDGSEEVADCFEERSARAGVHSAGHQRGNRPGNYQGGSAVDFGGIGYGRAGFRVGDSGSAARFYYCAKASKADRGEGNNHPTVKPTTLMRYLCRLVTPPGGIILDPFAGSGSTLKAALLERFKPVGIELNEEYCRIAEERLRNTTPPLPFTQEKQEQMESGRI